MRHMMIPVSWKSAKTLAKVIRKKEENGWNVVALGEISGSNLLILAEDGRRYEHQVIQLFWSLRGKVTDIIAEKQKKGWLVATIGNCLGSSLMILKREIPEIEEEDIQFFIEGEETNPSAIDNAEPNENHD